MPITGTDLTKVPPRSPRVRLGGYVLLPRMLDKGRASLAGQNGDYNYGCPLDQRFLEFTGIAAAALKKQLASGKGDGAIFKWIEANTKPKRNPTEIAAWSAASEVRVPTDVETRAFLTRFIRRSHPIAKTSRPGSICWIWMITFRSEAKRNGNRVQHGLAPKRSLNHHS